jgi:hypothetical protein
LQTIFIPRILILGPDGIIRKITPIKSPSGAESGRYDLREGLIEATGIEFPEGALAVYDEAGSTLAMLAPDELITLVEMLGAPGGVVDYQVRVTAALAEFEIERPDKVRQLPYSRLRSVAGNSWRETEELTITSRSGQRAVARQRYGGEPRKERPPQELGNWTPPLAAGEAGVAIAVEPVVGADGRTIDLNCEWHRRLGKGENSEQFETTSTVKVVSGGTVVAAVWPAFGEGGAIKKGRVRSLALILRADILNTNGVPIREAFIGGIEKVREAVKSKRK